MPKGREATFKSIVDMEVPETTNSLLEKFFTYETDEGVEEVFRKMSQGIEDDFNAFTLEKKTTEEIEKKKTEYLEYKQDIGGRLLTPRSKYDNLQPLAETLRALLQEKIDALDGYVLPEGEETPAPVATLDTAQQVASPEIPDTAQQATAPEKPEEAIATDPHTPRLIEEIPNPDVSLLIESHIDDDSKVQDVTSFLIKEILVSDIGITEQEYSMLSTRLESLREAVLSDIKYIGADDLRRLKAVISEQENIWKTWHKTKPDLTKGQKDVLDIYIDCLTDIKTSVVSKVKKPKKGKDPKALQSYDNKTLERFADQDGSEKAPAEGRHELFVPIEKLKEQRRKLKTPPATKVAPDDGTPAKTTLIPRPPTPSTSEAEKPFTDLPERDPASRKTPQPKPEAAPKPPTPQEKPAELVQPPKIEITEPVEPTRAEILEAILYGDIDSANPEILGNAKFESWIERIAHTNHSHGGYILRQQTLEEWFNVYTSQVEKIKQAESLIGEKKIGDIMFKAFETEKDKALAKRRALEKFEWDFVTNPEVAEKKLADILQIKESCEKHEAHIKKLAEEKAMIERSLKSTGLRIPGEHVYAILYGEAAEHEKANDFTDFLRDMSINYKYYHGKIRNERDNDMERMFKVYERSRESDLGEYTSWVKKIGFLKGLLPKVGAITDSSAPNYYDMMSFENIIRALQKAELVQTTSTGENQAHTKMEKLFNFSRGVEFATRHDMSVEDYLDTLPDSEDKETFMSVFNTYVKNSGSYSTLQKKAKAKSKTADVLAPLDKKSAEAQANISELDTELENTINDDDFETFVFKIRIELQLGELQDMIKELKSNKNLGIQRLTTIEENLKKLENVDTSGEIYLVMRQANLELSQAYTRILSSQEAGNLVPTHIRHYENILGADEKEIPKAKKKEYITAVLESLRGAMAKKKGLFKELRIKNLIAYFEKVEKSLS